MIPEDQIEEVKARADIVDVVSDYVALKRRGANYLGLCPFHSEKTPSFTVNEDKGIFYCFGCGVGGNVISFLIKHEALEFPEAVRRLAERYGVKIVESGRGGGGKGTSTERERIIELNRKALAYFREQLFAPGGKEAFSYLDERGFGKAVVEDFRLGYAPESWDGLTGHLKDKGCDIELAVRAGLVGRKDNRYYDRFRGRIIFPITDSEGKVVAFGGRSTDGSEPKYLNSPESVAFKKAETLYGLYKAKGGSRKEGYTIVVEGYFDLIALHREGFTNSVATMGTALTPRHLRRLGRYAKNIYLLFDSDEAGRKAALRGLEHFLDTSLCAKVVMLPPGNDPDDFLIKDGRKGMERAIKEAVPLVEFFLEESKRRVSLESAEGKGAYLDMVLPVVAMIGNIAERSHYATMVASLVGVDSKALFDEMGRVKKSAKRVATRGEGERKESQPLAEATILKVIIRHPELYSLRVAKCLDNFAGSLTAPAARLIKDHYAESEVFDSQRLLDKAEDDEVKGLIAESLVGEDDGFIEAPERMLDDCIDKVTDVNGPRETTKEIVRRLKESGRDDMAEKILSSLNKST